MLKQRALLLLSLCFAIPAQAGILEDDDARAQIKQLEMRVLAWEEAVKQQTKSLLDLQGQIEALNTEIRKLRGQNEEIAHSLQEAEKRQKDFYVDLDTRLRHFESAEEAAKETAKETAAKTPVALSLSIPQIRFTRIAPSRPPMVCSRRAAMRVRSRHFRCFSKSIPTRYTFPM
jgi:TolA-binding protein